ncbi:LysR family transcriptional regulator ArgP [Azospirillum picis]|uniref:LysR family transcriptional regulator (Chromosome initiation inhibitor) n=1 Tax=Azospirillum picis TaxID=488438 RepID=A0ABU0MIL3_9PROT|nr:LysR family transcriptional regulator ArgP [Azospirillum picis]MBP2299569.1 LysR family transcriptional regulator (chromosome initiation inhibitor) [Azospirillum picis]MDQ0533304.1 LysR family transcriptional regulator (chromosome initiation inhibitor) [Azospirillum picis]
MLDYPLLSALAAVIRTGSFERAAQQLHVTPSAVSQRVKLLEERLGSVLVVRGQPCTGTAAGLRLCQHVERVALLESDLRDTLPGLPPADAPLILRIAVNADSLATWFIAAMTGMPGCLFDLVLDDQDHSAEWLRQGEVVAAVTASAAPVPGCSSHPLGALRYRATASPDYMRRHFPRGVDEESLSRAPCLTFNRKDRLQAQWLATVSRKAPVPPTHWLPASQAFVDGALAGLGWGMNPDLLVAGHLAAGRLVELVPGRPLDVPLFWQQSRISGSVLADLTRAVLRAGRDVLHQPSAPQGGRDG